MPDTARCTHPFNTPRLDDAFRSRCLLIVDLPLEKERQRCDAGMRMKTDRRCVLRIDVEIIQKHKGFDDFAQVRRTDEPRNGSMRTSARTVGDATKTCFHRRPGGARCGHIHADTSCLCAPPLVLRVRMACSPWPHATRSSSMALTAASWWRPGFSVEKFSKSVCIDRATWARTSATLISPMTSRRCATARVPP